MVSIKKHASKTLRWRTLSSTGERRGLKGYFSLAHGEQPSWWGDGLANELPRAIGIFENVRRSMTGALVITRDRLLILPVGPRTLRYADACRSSVRPGTRCRFDSG